MKEDLFILTLTMKMMMESDKIISILYCPINAKSKKKMLYSTTFGSLNSQLGGGISTEMQCDSPAELSREHILKKVKK